jgi:hypothetical protein
MAVSSDIYVSGNLPALISGEKALARRISLVAADGCDAKNVQSPPTPRSVWQLKTSYRNRKDA